WVLALKVEQRHQVADGGTVGREIGGTGDAFRIGKIVAAVRRQRLQSPVFLNEFQQRGVVAISVVHVPGLGERRDYDERNARTIAEKVNGLNVAGVVKSARLVEGNEDGSCLPQSVLRLDGIHQIADEGFVQLRQRCARVAIHDVVRLHE